MKEVSKVYGCWNVFARNLNAQLKAAGRLRTYLNRHKFLKVLLSTEQQRIINDARRSYQAKLNAINVASGNTEVYKALLTCGLVLLSLFTCLVT